MDGDWNWRCFLEVDTLDCPICTEPLSSPIYQCENGHPICSGCSRQLSIDSKGCPSCTQPTGRIRCLAMEKVLESLQVPCQNGPHGCGRMLPFNQRAEREDHEKNDCRFQSFPCPIPSCSHEGPVARFSSHIEDAHPVVSRFPCDFGYERARVTFYMSSEEHCVSLGRSRSANSGIVDGVVLVHREEDEQGDWFYCSSYGVEVHYKLVVQVADADVIRNMKAIAHDFSRVSERESRAGVVERLLVPNDAQQASNGIEAIRLFNVKVVVMLA